MTSQVTLLLICMLFSRALSLTCLQCLPSVSGTCNNIQTTCPDQCLTLTTSVYSSGTNLSYGKMKTCGMTEMCVSMSMNLGMMKMTYNAKCCSTDLCNSETLPALPQQAPNGRMCYTYAANGYSGKMSCEGNEDRCMTASVRLGSNTLSVLKGCVSKNFCVASGSSGMPEIGLSNVECCEGNLCNTGNSSGDSSASNTGSSSGDSSASNTGSSSGDNSASKTLSFLLMIVPLLSSILFY
ncbi:phospholipase A2 inhibitor gamma subunit B-like isoform X2 [Pangasianodon hypophthalmus]|uniref:phospholipase A2 inhibitor gamma subunit B-like isoform X2 n=1 Tax=Pangasianodon hypophthalmus TaxID=310915 RepID=UPI002306FC4A|nr:phospholipase A2 inhibitor gamma subunit B-like isoform X2 [Pangasianodon hypophthalmus]